MSVRTYLCGTSQTVYHARSEPVAAGRPLTVRPQREPGTVRLRTALHMPGLPRATRGYRVVAELADGGQTLICLGLSLQEAIARARQRASELPAQAVAVRLQEWVGSAIAGRWRDVRSQRLALPNPRPRRRRSA